MKDSSSTQVDSFVVISNEKDAIHYQSDEYDSYKLLIRDIPTNTMSDTTNWYILLNRIYQNRLVYDNPKLNLQLMFEDIIGYSKQADVISLTQNGVSYDSVYYRPALYSEGYAPVKDLKLSIAINRANGFISLRDNIPGYSHSWQVLRSVIK